MDLEEKKKKWREEAEKIDTRELKMNVKMMKKVLDEKKKPTY